MERPEGAASVETRDGPALVVREEPLLIEVAGAPPSADLQSILTMRTPGHDEELALGFLLAEGILGAPADAAAIERRPRGQGAAVDVVRVTLTSGRALAPVARERLTRAHAVRPSCGLCGLASAEGLTRDLRALTPERPRVSLAALARMAARMRAEQPLFAATGGAHAAALFDASDPERPWLVREDVGRHNALDKALGGALRQGRELSRAVAILSGRGGYELVLKALRLGVPVLAAVGAPTSLAVELAEAQGLTLVGFLRGEEGARVYCDDGRLTR